MEPPKRMGGHVVARGVIASVSGDPRRSGVPIRPVPLGCPLASRCRGGVGSGPLSGSRVDRGFRFCRVVSAGVESSKCRGSATRQVGMKPREALRCAAGSIGPPRLGTTTLRSPRHHAIGVALRAASRGGAARPMLHEEFASLRDGQSGDLLEGGIRLEPHPRAAPVHLPEQATDAAGRGRRRGDHDLRDDVALRGEFHGRELRKGERPGAIRSTHSNPAQDRPHSLARSAPRRRDAARPLVEEAMREGEATSEADCAAPSSIARHPRDHPSIQPHLAAPVSIGFGTPDADRCGRTSLFDERSSTEERPRACPCRSVFGIAEKIVSYPGTFFRYPRCWRVQSLTTPMRSPW